VSRGAKIVEKLTRELLFSSVEDSQIDQPLITRREDGDVGESLEKSLEFHPVDGLTEKLLDGGGRVGRVKSVGGRDPCVVVDDVGGEGWEMEDLIEGEREEALYKWESSGVASNKRSTLVIGGVANSETRV
jgi:hypothetical protein